jgi:hypothetical protein
MRRRRRRRRRRFFFIVLDVDGSIVAEAKRCSIIL